MIYLTGRDRDGIFVRSARNNARPRPGETHVPGAIADRFSLLLSGAGDGYRPTGELYRLLDRVVPDTGGDLDAIRREAEVLARRVEDAVNAAAAGLKGQGVGHPNLAAILKYEILRRLDSPRKVRGVERVRHEGIAT